MLEKIGMIHVDGRASAAPRAAEGTVTGDITDLQNPRFATTFKPVFVRQAENPCLLCCLILCPNLLQLWYTWEFMDAYITDVCTMN